MFLMDYVTMCMVRQARHPSSRYEVRKDAVELKM